MKDKDSSEMLAELAKQHQQQSQFVGNSHPPAPGHIPSSNATAALFASRMIVGGVREDVHGMDTKVYDIPPPPLKEKTGKKLSKRR